VDSGTIYERRQGVVETMRISELAEASGVALPTVKYYLREGLLPPGRAVSSRLSEYDEEHLRRLRLLRVLREVGDVPVSRLRALAEAVEAGQEPFDLLQQTAEALAPPPPPAGPARRQAREDADLVITEAGWRIHPRSPDRENLAAAMEALATFGWGHGARGGLRPYVEAADTLARHEIAGLDTSHGGAALLEQMVLGQVLLGHVLDVLRRLAEEHHSRERFT
jgi:DNA-binding transcriptional MerR regulator